jgi:hypothetical protein
MTIGAAVEELIPASFGLVLGAALGRLTPRLRLPVGTVLAVALGVTATIVTGEATISWAFVLVDIPIVAICTAAGVLLGRRLSPEPARAPGGP